MPRIKSEGSSEKYKAIRADAASAGIMETNIDGAQKAGWMYAS